MAHEPERACHPAIHGVARTLARGRARVGALLASIGTVIALAEGDGIAGTVFVAFGVTMGACRREEPPGSQRGLMERATKKPSVLTLVSVVVVGLIAVVIVSVVLWAVPVWLSTFVLGL